MASRVFLHVGLPKSGTSYLQSVLWANQAALGEHGLLVPGEWRDHYHANLHIRGVATSGVDPETLRQTWDRMAAEIEEWQGDALITHELFAGTPTERATAMVQRLRPAEVQVVVSARDMLRTVPASWQQSLKAGHTESLQEFATSIVEQTEVSRWFRLAQDPEGVLERFGAVVPAKHRHLVTVPPAGGRRDLLWRRFCDVLGLDPDRYCLDTPQANESLGATEAELLRRVNLHLVPRLPSHQTARWIRDELAEGLLVHRGGDRFALPAQFRPWAVERGLTSIERLRASGCQVHGDLDDLLPVVDGALPPGGPDAVPAEDLLDAATETVAELVVRLRDATQRAHRAERKLERRPVIELPPPPPAPSLPRRAARRLRRLLP